MDYQKAKDIREKSFSDMMVKNLTQGNGIGESFSKTISEKTQARVKGFKQAIDPMQIAKTLTFGSNLAPALLGKLTGRSNKDIKFFSGKRKKSKTDFGGLDNSVSGVSKDTDGSKKIVEVLGLIYRQLNRAEEDRKFDKIQKETEEKTQHQKDEEYENKSNQDLVKALTARFKPKKKTKTGQARDEKGRFTKTDKETPTPNVDTTPKGTIPKVDTTPKVTAPKVETPNVFKPNPARTATPTETTPIIPSKVSKGIAVGAVAAVASKIAKAESRGSSEKSYTQANIVGKESSEAQIVKDNIDVTTGKPFDKSLNEMTIGEVIALGERRYEHYKVPDPNKPGKFIYRGGSAMGKYQFIPKTLAEQAKKLYGPGWENHEFNNQAQEDINASFILNNEERLKNAGLPVTDASLYMMHFFGNEKQTAMVLNGDENTKMSEILGDFASKQNPGVAKMTVLEYKNYLRKKGFDFQIVDLAAESKRLSEISDNSVGKRADALSKESVDLKESLNKDNPAQIQVNNGQSSSTQNTQQKSEESVDDRPALIRKRRM